MYEIQSQTLLVYMTYENIPSCAKGEKSSCLYIWEEGEVRRNYKESVGPMTPAMLYRSEYG